MLGIEVAQYETVLLLHEVLNIGLVVRLVAAALWGDAYVVYGDFSVTGFDGDRLRLKVYVGCEGRVVGCVYT